MNIITCRKFLYKQSKQEQNLELKSDCQKEQVDQGIRELECLGRNLFHLFDCLRNLTFELIALRKIQREENQKANYWLCICFVLFCFDLFCIVVLYWFVLFCLFVLF